MYINKSGPTEFGRTSWRLSGAGTDRIGNMAEMEFRISIMADDKGIYIGGESGFIPWADLEKAKVDAQK